MTTASPKTWTHARARVASLSRARRDDDPELVDARRDLKGARLEEYVRQLVETWPPLKIEHAERVAALLKSGVSGA